jgi:hypothetical protein
MVNFERKEMVLFLGTNGNRCFKSVEIRDSKEIVFESFQADFQPKRFQSPLKKNFLFSICGVYKKNIFCERSKFANLIGNIVIMCNCR